MASRMHSLLGVILIASYINHSVFIIQDSFIQVVDHSRFVPESTYEANTPGEARVSVYTILIPLIYGIELSALYLSLYSCLISQCYTETATILEDMRLLNLNCAI